MDDDRGFDGRHHISENDEERVTDDKEVLKAVKLITKQKLWQYWGRIWWNESDGYEWWHGFWWKIWDI